MHLSKESVEEFRDIYEAEFGERLSFDEAKEQATWLLDFGLFVYNASRRLDEEQDKREENRL